MAEKPSISLEFFPPKTEKSRQKFYKEVEKLEKLAPDFMTVTYGAGGSTKAWTMETAVAIQKQTGIPTATHLTCVNTFKKDMMKIVDELWENGISHIVALRGDVPPEDAPLDYGDPNYYHYANDLVDALDTRHDFEISVAAYPEKHPECDTLAQDIQNLKRKCESGNGVARAITQFFFENDVYYRFLDKTAKAGITTPIVPGLLPVINLEKMLKFAKTCQANVPDAVKKRFAGIKPGTEAARQAGVDLLAEQITDLVAHDVPHIHFYTLNKADMVAEACKAAGLRV